MSSATSTSKEFFQPDSNVHITFEDRQKGIHKFARYRAKLEDYKKELEMKRDEFRRLRESEEELLLVKDDDGEKIPFVFGLNFTYENLENTLKSIEEFKSVVLSEIQEIKDKRLILKSVMRNLRIKRYTKSENHINLEVAEE